MPTTFERVVCISLSTRAARWQRFQSRLPSNWPFGNVEKFNAIDGLLCPPPKWWTGGAGSWGCFKSHLNIIEECLNDQIESCLIFEDDAVFHPNSILKYEQFAKELPNDWEVIYLGGQHTYALTHPPKRVSGNVFRPFNVNRTHAYAIRGNRAFRLLYQHLAGNCGEFDPQHVDHHLGRLHEQNLLKIYCPSEWFVGQDEGLSDLCGEILGTRFFPPACYFEPPNFPLNFVQAVLESKHRGRFLLD